MLIFWKKKWEKIIELDGRRIKDVQKKFSYLKSKGIRCRFRTLHAKQPSSMLLSAKIEVHRDDVNQAHQWLAELN